MVSKYVYQYTQGILSIKRSGNGDHLRTLILHLLCLTMAAILYCICTVTTGGHTVFGVRLRVDLAQVTPIGSGSDAVQQFCPAVEAETKKFGELSAHGFFLGLHTVRVSIETILFGAPKLDKMLPSRGLSRSGPLLGLARAVSDTSILG